MEIYSLLRKHSINLSILIYPWPGTLIHDNENSKYVEIWKNFCFDKCKIFLNSFPIFDELNYIDNQKLLINIISNMMFTLIKRKQIISKLYK